MKPLIPALVLAAVGSFTPPAPAQSGLVGQYTFETGVPGQIAGQVVDTSPAGNHGTGFNDPQYSGITHPAIPCTGPADSAVSLTLNEASASAQAVRFQSTFPFNLPSDATVTFWLKSPFASHAAIIWCGSNLLEFNNTNFFQIFVNTDGTIGVNYREPTGALHCLGGTCSPSGGTPFPVNQWFHFALVRSGTNYRIYKNGELVFSGFDSNPALQNAPTWGIGARPGTNFVGTIDDLRLYTRALTPSEFLQDPIVTSPTSVSSCYFGTASFTVSAVSGGPLTYRWRKDGAFMDLSANPSASTPHLTLSSIQATDAGVYDCVVANACRNVLSDPAGLQVGLLADLTHDNAVDTVDLVVLLGNFGGSVPIGTNGDLTGDGIVNTADLVVLLGQFGRTCP